MADYRRNKIAFCTISTHIGGADKSLIDFLILLHEEHRQFFTVIVPKKTGPLIDQLVLHKIDYHVIPMPELLLKLSRKKILASLILAIPCLFSMFLYIRQINTFLKREKITIIHSTGLKFHLICSLMALGSSTKVFIHIRDILRSRLLIFFFSLMKKMGNL